MEVAKLSWSLAMQVVVCRGRADEAGAESLPSSRSCCTPRTAMLETPEARGTGIEKAPPHTDL